MLWLAKQGLVPPIAISSLIVLILSCIMKQTKTKGDDAMGNKINYTRNIVTETMFAMSGNLAGGALLANAHYHKLLPVARV